MTTTEPTVAPPTAAAAAAPSNTMSIIGIVLAVVGIALGQWLLSVAALVLGLVARTREPHAITLANWALVLGIVGTFGWLLVGVAMAIGALPFLAFGWMPFAFDWPFLDWPF